MVSTWCFELHFKYKFSINCISQIFCTTKNEMFICILASVNDSFSALS